MSDLSQAGRIVLSVPLALGVIAFAAFQRNATHVFNPKWHPHARFHAVQRGLFFIAVSGTGLWLIWGSSVGLPTAGWPAPCPRVLGRGVRGPADPGNRSQPRPCQPQHIPHACPGFGLSAP